MEASGRELISKELNEVIKDTRKKAMSLLTIEKEKEVNIFGMKTNIMVSYCKFCESDKVSFLPEKSFYITSKNEFKEEPKIENKVSNCCDRYSQEMKKLEKQFNNRIQKLIIEYRRKLVNQEIEINRENSMIGERFKNRIFETWNSASNGDPKEKCEKYCENFDPDSGDQKGIIMAGKPGSGKTHIASAISNRLIDKGFSVMFLNVVNLIKSMKNFQESDGLFKRMGSVDLLVIDDLGKEYRSDWAKSIIYSLINERYENYKPIVFTTNLSADAMEKQIDPAVVSRIYEMCYILPFKFDDYRKLQREYL